MIRASAAIVFGAVLFAAPALAADAALIAAAKKEGTVVWYTTQIPDQFARPASSAFEKQYPGMKVVVSRTNATTATIKIMNENRAGKNQSDVFDGTTTVVPLKRAGYVLQWLPDAAKTYPPQYKDKDGYWIATNLYVLTPAFNTSIIAPGTEPKTLNDLLDPKWRGKMAWAVSLSSSAATGFIGTVLDEMGEDKGMAYLRQLRGQRIAGLDVSARQVLDQVIAGEFAIALQIFNHHAVISGKQGAPVKWIPMEPATGALSVVSISKAAPHPNAAKLFEDFLISPEGQKIYRDAAYLPADPNFAALDPSLKPEDGHFRSRFFTPEETSEKLPRWKKVYDEIFPVTDGAAKVAALLNPRNVVIMGASDRPGNWAARVWRNLKRYGFAGPVYPFNPLRESVWDTRCYRSFAEMPEAPDHLVVLIPAAAVPAALTDAARAGARSATVMTSGFGEDPNAEELTARLKRVIAETGLAVSGPNCLGNVHASARLMTMPDDRPQIVAPGPIALVGQSGGIVMAIKRTLEERGVASGSVVTSGNETGLTTADYIAYWAGEPEVKAIVTYLEAVHERDAFLAACRKARDAGKSVVAMKLGASDKGRAAALAHTGRLAGSMAAFDAVAGAAGVLRAADLDAVVEAVEYLLHAPAPQGRGLGAITFSGGFRGMMLDAAAAHGLSFSELARNTRKNLESLLTVGTIVGNPLDAGFAALTSQDAYLKCIEILLSDPGIDVLLLQEELPRGPGTERKEANLKAVEAIAARAGKPIAFATMISHGLTEYSRTLRAGLPHLAFLQEIGKAMSAVKSVMDASARVAAPIVAPPPRGAKAKLDRMLARANAGTLNEVQSKALLKAYGIPCPKETLVMNESEAVTAAKTIGFPVVAKAVSAALAHKSDVGGVILNLNSTTEVKAAYKRLTGPVARRAKATLDGVLIAQQLSDGIELMLGATRDPEMGPVILFGAGGVEVELAPDIALAPPPLDVAAAEALIARTRVAKRIAGYRGQTAYDKRALVKALVALSQLVTDSSGRIHSIDINPFLLRRKGGAALDALVVLT